MSRDPDLSRERGVPPRDSSVLEGMRPYEADDRSLLLPLYRRMILDPTVPLIPRRMRPNTITHIGHILCFSAAALLLAFWPESGWLYVLSAVLLQVYLWCDNADGTHARGTGQCSAMGEFLDHGLDQFNTCYIALLSAMALGASPMWWVVLAITIPGIAAVVFWEQSQTGLFRVGLLNQIESLMVVSAALCARGLLGPEFWYELELGGLSLGLGLLLFSTLGLITGAVHGIVRVHAHSGLRSLAPVSAFVLFASTLAAAASLNAIPVAGAVVLALAGNVFFGFRSLLSRLHGHGRHGSRSLLTITSILAVLMGLRLAGMPPSPVVSYAVVAFSGLVLCWLVIVDAREGLHHLRGGGNDPAAPLH